MKKDKTPIEFEDPDPFDGMKALGCLLIGSVLIAVALFLFGVLIKVIQ